MSDPKEVADLVATLSEGIAVSPSLTGDGSHIDIPATEAKLQRAASTLQSLSADLDRVTAERDALLLQAQSHAQEARTANATIYEIYQALSGGKGEPGNWNGARPAREYVERTEARISTLTEALRKIASDEVETAFMFRLIASEALGALPTQGEQP